MFEHHISQEAFERLHVWCLAKCPRALEDPEFLPGLIVILEEEVEKALRIDSSALADCGRLA